MESEETISATEHQGPGRTSRSKSRCSSPERLRRKTVRDKSKGDMETEEKAPVAGQSGTARTSRSRSRCSSCEKLKRRRVRNDLKGKRNSENSNNESIVSMSQSHCKNGRNKSLLERNSRKSSGKSAGHSGSEVHRKRGRPRGTSVEQRNTTMRDSSSSTSEEATYLLRRKSRNKRRRQRSRSPDRNPRRHAREHRHSRLNTFLESSSQSDSNDNECSKRRRYSRASSVNDSNNTNSTHIILNKFMDILKEMKGSGQKLSTNNVLPDFDPMIKDQNVLMWLTKVEECAEIYGWTEKEIIHFALPKLKGIAKSWYQGLSTVLYSWSEWKKKLVESFPCRDDYAELLTIMLSKRARYNESLEQYYYEKMNMLNRCGISGRRAVDCILHGIDDRAVRVGGQAAQFREPEGVLKYLKTIKAGSSKEINDKTDRVKHERKYLGSPFYKRKTDQPKKTICYNCSEEGHFSFNCVKTLQKCTTCNRVGHISVYCKFNRDNIQNKNDTPKNMNIKDVKQLATATESNEKYTIEISVNDVNLQCYVDLGSQCTLLREREAKQLNLNYQTDNLPLMKGIGGQCVAPLGKCQVNVTVQGIQESIEVFIVDDQIIKYPVLLGHTFTEKPNIFITKTPEQIVFEKKTSDKLFLRVPIDIVLLPKELSVVLVDSGTDYTGRVYVGGDAIRGGVSQEYCLLPGEYFVKAGKTQVLLINLSDKNITFKKNRLLTRATLVLTDYEIFKVEFNKSDLDDAIICGPQFSEDERWKLQNLLTQYSECFSSSLKDLGITNVGEMVIELNNSEPVVYRPYRMSYVERNLVRDMVDEMLSAGIVKESSSPYASPIVLVKKKTGEKRLCIDYRALNQRTKKDHYPLPRVEDQLDQLAGNNLFISLDLASGYYQIPIAETSRDKTAFITPDGQYEFTRMPFGLVNAPSVFQRLINKILMAAKIKFALVYMDDILIPARSFDDGLDRLEQVLKLLREGGLTLKLSKCNFFFGKIDFLGFEVSSEGIQPGSRKTEAVAKFPTPKSQHELRQFIGLASFFRRFVQGFAVIARPLTDLLRKNIDWKWGTDQETAFKTLKDILTSRPLLALYDPIRETQIHTDACKHGVAGILLQKDEAELFKPVSYFSRKTTTDEQKLHSFELETLAVVATLSRFRVYLLGIPFKIFTDCNALRTTLTKRDLVPRIARWWVQLQEYDCAIEYRAGTNMAHADALSRNPTDDAIVEEHLLDVLSNTIDDWIATVQSNDSELVRIKDVLSDPESNNVMDIIKNYKLKNGKVFKIIDGGENESLRWVVPKGVRWQVVKMNHDDIGHFGFEKTLIRIQQSFWFPKMRRFVKKYVKSCLQCAHHKGSTGKQTGELHPIPKIEIPFHTVHADHLGPFVKSSKGNTYILVLVDAFTKFINIKPVKNTKTSTTIKVLQDHISFFGAPTRLVTDQGTSFTSNNFRAFIKKHGIKHVLNAVATPRANGQVERFNRTILEALATKCHDKNDRSWDQYLQDIQVGLNTTVHKTTRKSPSELLFGIKIKSSSENLLSEVIDETLDNVDSNNLNENRIEASRRICEQQQKYKKAFDSKRKQCQSFHEGDLVCVKREVPSDGKSKKLVMKYQGPYRVKKVLPHERYLVEDTPITQKTGRRKYENFVAIDKLKPWLSFNKDFESSSESDENKSGKED